MCVFLSFFVHLLVSAATASVNKNR